VDRNLLFSIDNYGKENAMWDPVLDGGYFEEFSAAKYEQDAVNNLCSVGYPEALNSFVMGKWSNQFPYLAQDFRSNFQKTLRKKALMVLKKKKEENPSNERVEEIMQKLLARRELIKLKDNEGLFAVLEHNNNFLGKSGNALVERRNRLLQEVAGEDLPDITLEEDLQYLREKYGANGVKVVKKGRGDIEPWAIVYKAGKQTYRLPKFTKEAVGKLVDIGGKIVPGSKQDDGSVGFRVESCKLVKDVRAQLGLDRLKISNRNRESLRREEDALKHEFPNVTTEPAGKEAFLITFYSSQREAIADVVRNWDKDGKEEDMKWSGGVLQSVSKEGKSL